jgi:biotin synthase-related radical SAM superfamily protein
MMVVKDLKQTCSASPTQREGVDQDGNAILTRYRWGYLSIEKNGKEVFGKQLDESMSGRLTYDELKEATKDSIIWT